MQENTKKKLSQYVETVAQQNGVSDATEMFSVNPNATQRIIAAIRDYSIDPGNSYNIKLLTKFKTLSR